VVDTYHAPLWPTPLQQKGGAMTSFADGAIKKDVCYLRAHEKTPVTLSFMYVVLF